MPGAACNSLTIFASDINVHKRASKVIIIEHNCMFHKILYRLPLSHGSVLNKWQIMLMRCAGYSADLGGFRGSHSEIHDCLQTLSALCDWIYLIICFSSFLILYLSWTHIKFNLYATKCINARNPVCWKFQIKNYVSLRVLISWQLSVALADEIWSLADFAPRNKIRVLGVGLLGYRQGDHLHTKCVHAKNQQGEVKVCNEI